MNDALTHLLDSAEMVGLRPGAEGREKWLIALSLRYRGNDPAVVRFVRDFPQHRKTIVDATVADVARPPGMVPVDEPVVLLVYHTNAKAGQNVIGLGVNASMSAKALTRCGVVADAISPANLSDLAKILRANASARVVVIEDCIAAPGDVAQFVGEFPRVQFFARCHSQVAFLQVQPDATLRMRTIAEMRLPNLHLAGNSRRFTEWASSAWGVTVEFVPNLYVVGDGQLPRIELADRGILRLASFGALRLQKHHTTAAAAAVIVGQRLRAPVEFHLNVGRNDGGGDGPKRTIHALVDNLAGFRIVEVSWQAAEDFRQTIASMDLCFQLSATETFNLVTADAANACVPSVVSEAIDWAPPDWRAPIDDPLRAAETAIRLLGDPTAGLRGRRALIDQSEAALQSWLQIIQR